MNGRLSKLLERLTSEEWAEMETFAMFILARRSLYKVQFPTDSLSAEELVRLLKSLGESEAPERQRQSTPPQRSIFELKGLGKEAWQGIDAQEYVDRERDSWRG